MTKRMGIMQEFALFLREYRAYWLAPVILMVLLLAGLVTLSVITGGAAAPFIYTLF